MAEGAVRARGSGGRGLDVGYVPVGTARRRYLPPGWPVYALFAGFPVWWILGLGGLIWPVLAVPMAIWLFRLPVVRAPKGFTIWVAFMIWMIGSGTQIDNSIRYVAFTYRVSLYASATIVLLYIFNLSREALPTRAVIGLMAVFWMYVVAGGFMGVLAPTWEFKSPVEYVMPQALISDEFVHDLVHPASSQIQDVLGYEQPRPKAPFVYATNWGSAFSLLTPFVILGWMYARSRAWKILTALMFVAAIVPVVVSLDRGLWLSLGVGIVYAAIRLALGGRTRALRAILILIPTMLGLVYLTPLRGVVQERFAHPHSNERRLSLYQEAIDNVKSSPLLGFGGPRPSEENSDAPSVGTQGQFWLVLFSHGIPGAVFFVWWLMYQAWRFRASAPPVPFWCHVLIVMALVQLPVYGWLPAPMIVIVVGVAIAAREVLDPTPVGDLAQAVGPRPRARPMGWATS
ncbi:MAG: O-antigen ligase family protein [Actinomycetota bacterium]